MAHTPLSRTKRILRHFEDCCVAYLCGAFLVALIAAGIWWVGRNDARIREMASWPTTDAVIVSSRVNERPIPDDHHLLTELFIEVHVKFDHDGVAREASFSEVFHRGLPLDYKKVIAPGQTVRIQFDQRIPNASCSDHCCQIDAYIGRLIPQRVGTIHALTCGWGTNCHQASRAKPQVDRSGKPNSTCQPRSQTITWPSR